MEEIIFNIPTIIALTIGLTEVIKRVGLPTRFCPIVSILSGIGMVFIGLVSFPLNLKILYGIVCGLSASGLFSSTKAITGK